MNKRLQVLKAWILNTRVACMAAARRRDNLILFGSVFAALTVMLAVTTVFLLKPARYSEVDLAKNQVSVADDSLRHPLTGEVLTTTLERFPLVYGVMVENSADAWPLSGVEDAFLVIEAPVEGNIPRFEAFYSSDKYVDKIGPVRSARAYYLDWASEFNAIYAHVGGSPEALDIVSERDRVNVYDLNEFFQGEYFWRDVVRRAAPHNVYTATDRLWESSIELKTNLPEPETWLFKHDAPTTTAPLSLNIDWSASNLYDLVWTYDLDSNTYVRHQNYELVKSTDGDLIHTNNLVVLATDIGVVDSLGRLQIRTLGEGDALLMQDGKLVLCKWKKPSLEARLRFYDLSGQELHMNAGQTWIEIVPSLDRAETFISRPL